jgi:hypothetical protein
LKLPDAHQIIFTIRFNARQDMDGKPSRKNHVRRDEAMQKFPAAIGTHRFLTTCSPFF